MSRTDVHRPPLEAGLVADERARRDNGVVGVIDRFDGGEVFVAGDELY